MLVQGYSLDSAVRHLILVPRCKNLFQIRLIVSLRSCDFVGGVPSLDWTVSRARSDVWSYVECRCFDLANVVIGTDEWTLCLIDLLLCFLVKDCNSTALTESFNLWTFVLPDVFGCIFLT